MAYEEITGDLADIVGRENVLVSEEDCRVYSYDGTSNWVHNPDVVVFPTETEHVEAVLKLANEKRIPVTPRGGGTNVSRGSVPIISTALTATAPYSSPLMERSYISEY